MRKMICILLAVTLLALSAAGEPATGQWDSVTRLERSENLLVCRGGKWGMTDADGAVILKPQFDRMPEFDGRFAVARVDNPLYNEAGLSHSADDGYLHGLIDCEGEIIIPVVYDELKIVANTTLVEVRAGNYCGFMNLHGEDVTGLRYDLISRLDDEYSAVRDAKTGLWGVYYHAGRQIIPCEYDEYDYINEQEQLISMRKGTEPVVYTRFRLRNGEAVNLTEAETQAAQTEARAMDITLPEGCDQLSRIPGSENYLARKGELWGMMAPDGSLILDFQFDKQPEFTGSWALCTVADPEPREGFSGEEVYGSYYGVIDKNGAFILKPEYYELTQSEDGGMVRITLGEVYQFMNLETGRMLPGSYDRAESFQGNYAAVGMKGAQVDDNISAPEVMHWGTIDRNGKTGIQMGYDFLEMGEGDIATVKLGDRYGYLHADGREITRCRYDSAQPFKGGLAAVAKKIGEGTPKDSQPYEYAWGAIDETGAEVIPCIYDDLAILENGLVKTGVDGLYGLADRTGKILIKPRYFRILDFEGGYAVVGVRMPKPEGEQQPSDEYEIFWGMIDSEGNEVLPPQYNSAGLMEDGTIVAGLKTGPQLYFKVQDGKAVPIDEPSIDD